MTSYQRLKRKYEMLLEREELFKNVLTIATLPPKVETDKQGNMSFTQYYYCKATKELDKIAREELMRWVVQNLDKERILKLLEIKEQVEKLCQKN